VNYLQNKTCKAFAGGIPDAIWSGDILHDTPIDGDNGILFKRKPLYFPDIDEETEKRLSREKLW
jgi:hypothetical protein